MSKQTNLLDMFKKQKACSQPSSSSVTYEAARNIEIIFVIEISEVDSNVEPETEKIKNKTDKQ